MAEILRHRAFICSICDASPVQSITVSKGKRLGVNGAGSLGGVVAAVVVVPAEVGLSREAA